MKHKKWTAVVLFTTLVLSLFGCRKQHVLDGPGMVNDQPWKAFSLSCLDSYSQYNFRLTVEQGDFAFLLTGECRDKNGVLHTIVEGVELSAEDLQFLRDLKLGDLSDAIVFESEESLPPDTPEVTLKVTFMDNQEVEKALSQDTSIEIYECFLPYFINN